jgi:phage tail sheath protein FI
MSFQLSPGVLVSEIDLTNVIPAVSTSIGAFVGTFAWGPVNEIVLLGSEQDLVQTFGKPTPNTATSFFTAANFLAYSNSLNVVRVTGVNARNAVASGTALTIQNRAQWDQSYSNGQATVGTFAAKFPGDLGNSLSVSIADSATFSSWTYKGLFTGAPGTSAWAAARGGSNDELHIVIIDSQGSWTGQAGTVLETFAFQSKSSDARSADGINIFYKFTIANQSQYVWWMDFPVGMTNWGTTAVGTTFISLNAVENAVLANGVSDNSIDSAQLEPGWDLFANPEAVDISLVMTADASLTTVAYVINNVALTRRDCVVFCSPQGTSVISNPGGELTAVKADRSTINVDTSYSFMDSGWKYQYDKYNDVYRWTPLNGDIAGLFARTDNLNDPWWSAAGLNRGLIKNVTKLAWSPNKAQQDELYKVGVNSVISLVGSGTVLWGDKTMQSKPSAFDRINVRRLFIVLEKAIALAAKYELFEFNDVFTRAQFRSAVEPFLRDVQGRRGIFNSIVVCDGTNNTPEIVDSNQFVADIYIKPARSINYIQLNFVAVRTGVTFDEIVGTSNTAN